MKILLVEDHPDSRRSLQRLLERRRHEVVAVASAEEADAALALHRFAFLILDWMLPGKSGIDLCREIRARDLQGTRRRCRQYVFGIPVDLRRQDLLPQRGRGHVRAQPR